MKNIFFKFIIPVIIAKETMLCVPNGPKYSDGELLTFTQMKCLKVPFSEPVLQCLEESFIDLEEALPNTYE